MYIAESGVCGESVGEGFFAALGLSLRVWWWLRGGTELIPIYLIACDCLSASSVFDITVVWLGRIGFCGLALALGRENAGAFLVDIIYNEGNVFWSLRTRA